VSILSNYKITSYKDAFELIGVVLNEKAKGFLRGVERHGYTERAICFAIWKSQDKLIKYRRDSSFWSILLNEIRIHAFKKNDPRWEYLKKQKADKEKAKIEEKQRLAAEKQRAKERAEREAKRKRDLFEHRRGIVCSVFGTVKLKCDNLESVVYFIQGENGGPIKIGLTQDIKKRLASLQTGYPDNLVVLALLPGDATIESEIHKLFSLYKLRGEWFQPDDKILAIVKNVKRSNLKLVSSQ